MFNSFNDFIAWEKASRDTIDVKVCYLDLAGDIVTGLFLSQLVFWYLPNNTGRTKLRIFKEGEYWLARTNKDWYEEIRLTEKQVRRAIDELKKKGIIQTKVFKFNGSPTTHIRIIKEVFIEQLKQVIGISSVITESSTENADNTSFALEGKTENTQQNPVNAGSALEGISICPTGHVEIDQRDKSITEITTEITTEINNSVCHIDNYNQGIPKKGTNKTDTNFDSDLFDFVKNNICFAELGLSAQRIVEPAIIGLLMGDYDNKVPRQVVYSALEKLNYNALQRALNSYDNVNTEQIDKPIRYFQRCLLNAPCETELEFEKFKTMLKKSSTG